ncbi:MAG: hypothetical protein FJ267_16290, partial [Planctomycetes bacterium]|nr:hypothetical protein [Planctomycetota bacterium]
MPITFSGLSSGIDSQSLITELTRFSQARIDNLTAKQRTESTRQNSLTNIETRLKNLQTKVGRLARTHGSIFDRRSVTSSETGLVTGATGSS